MNLVLPRVFKKREAKMKNVLKILVCVIVLAFVLGSLNSDEAYGKYPEKMITVIVPFKAGGGGDRWSRVLSTKAIDYFGQAWHVVNYPGAAATVGWKELLNRPADGYSIQYGSYTPVIAALKEEKPPIDVSHIKVVCYISPMRSVLVSKPGTEWSTWEGLKAYAKKNPGKITVGATEALLMGPAYLLEQAGIETTLVPYASTADSVADFLGGHIHMMGGSVSTVKPLIPEKAVAVVNTSEVLIPKMYKEFKDVPDAKAVGYEGMAFPRYISIHPETPNEIVDFISTKIGELLKDKSIKSLLKKMGEEIWFVPRAEAQKDYEKMTVKIKKVIKLLEK
jgi:tripartite-type tricarboxylate transporter receptor subunit TctC